MSSIFHYLSFFFFNDTATTEIYTLSYTTLFRSLMRAAGLAPAVVHTSVLVRAIQTADLALAEMERTWIPVRRSWRLNERHYGALQGLNKKETAEKFGEDKVKVWRRSHAVRPPALAAALHRPPTHDPRYASLPPH